MYRVGSVEDDWDKDAPKAPCPLVVHYGEALCLLIVDKFFKVPVESWEGTSARELLL